MALVLGHPGEPSSPLPRAPSPLGGQAPKRPMHADASVAGVDAFEDSPRRNRPHQLGKRCAFPTRGLNALLRSPSGGPPSTARTGPSSGYILNGSTIGPSVTFLDGLTGDERRGPSRGRGLTARHGGRGIPRIS